MNERTLFVAVAEYPDIKSAKQDFSAMKELRKDKLAGNYDAAIVTKTADGKVKVTERHESGTEPFEWSGALVGAVIGAVIPGALSPELIGGAAIGAGAAAITGHVRDGLPKKDLDEIGMALTEEDAALVVAGENTIDKAISEALQRETKLVKKHAVADLDDMRQQLDAEM